jgi:hypothetical protein
MRRQKVIDRKKLLKSFSLELSGNKFTSKFSLTNWLARASDAIMKGMVDWILSAKQRDAGARSGRTGVCALRPDARRNKNSARHGQSK